jgi:hypothetical protein
MRNRATRPRITYAGWTKTGTSTSGNTFVLTDHVPDDRVAAHILELAWADRVRVHRPSDSSLPAM